MHFDIRHLEKQHVVCCMSAGVSLNNCQHHSSNRRWSNEEPTIKVNATEPRMRTHLLQMSAACCTTLGDQSALNNMSFAVLQCNLKHLKHKHVYFFWTVRDAAAVQYFTSTFAVRAAHVCVWTTEAFVTMPSRLFLNSFLIFFAIYAVLSFLSLRSCAVRCASAHCISLWLLPDLSLGKQ